MDLREDEGMDDEAQRLEVLVKAARLVASEPALQGWPVVWKLRAAVQGLDLARGAQGGPRESEQLRVAGEVEEYLAECRDSGEAPEHDG